MTLHLLRWQSEVSRKNARETRFRVPALDFDKGYDLGKLLNIPEPQCTKL